MTFFFRKTRIFGKFLENWRNGNGNAPNLPGTEERVPIFEDRTGSLLKIEDRTGSLFEIFQRSQSTGERAIFCDPGQGSHVPGSQSIALNFEDRKVPRS